MKKVSELEGIELDWAVAKCEKEYVVFNNRQLRFPPGQFVDEEIYSPSTNWAQGGPIIERERIVIEPYNKDEWTATYKCPDACYDGPTPLIAAMRCYATFILGSETEIPEELAK